jgi:hypothetical protein
MKAVQEGPESLNVYGAFESVEMTKEWGQLVPASNENKADKQEIASLPTPSAGNA